MNVCEKCGCGRFYVWDGGGVCVLLSDGVSICVWLGWWEEGELCASVWDDDVCVCLCLE